MKALTLVALLAVAHAVQAADPVLLDFQRQQLSDQFWCEGASFADFDRDGHNDIVSGPWWYQGPGFTNRHEIYPTKSSFKLKLGPFTTVNDPGFEGALGVANTNSDNFFAYPRDFN
ncbi:MAG: VCBS repeat-containing protein, partial [Limisphaerales bacterium]